MSKMRKEKGMNDVKPRLTGPAAAAVGCVAIVCISVLEGIALWQGIDGTQFMAVIATIAALGGVAVGFKGSDILRK